MHVGVVAQKGNVRAAHLAGDLREELAARDVDVDVDKATARALRGDEATAQALQGDEATARALGEDEATATELDVDGVAVGSMGACDLVVSIGGDGTFLYAARGAGSVPILGVNLGEVGFLNAVSPADAHDAVLAEVDRYRKTGAVRSRALPRLAATGDDWSLAPAMNEIVVQGPQRGHGAGAGFEVRVDGELYSGGHADGVLVATATGSTAYNLSEDGPLVAPSAGTLVVTEMCAADAMPSLVLARDQTITVRVDDADAAHVISDGRETHELEPPATVEVGVADDPVRVAGPPVNFFEALGKLD
ncbi:NAD(+)/NADH kinase [Halorubellus sp. JP-L1]|uniref:NAD(+)/NADH kinase n=1 Tax=Halorubellus sp. JP-L1 TaxID=2715753 RepID=UPI001409C2B5|nr:NAD(+)/NADH kinase [Halorubellus sp. JP-L1]NHN41291.1 NAD(+)/NADH kinase [Halorubellus sp. JP-L1]